MAIDGGGYSHAQHALNSRSMDDWNVSSRRDGSQNISKIAFRFLVSIAFGCFDQQNRQRNDWRVGSKYFYTVERVHTEHVRYVCDLHSYHVIRLIFINMKRKSVDSLKWYDLPITIYFRHIMQSLFLFLFLCLIVVNHFHKFFLLCFNDIFVPLGSFFRQFYQ